MFEEIARLIGKDQSNVSISIMGQNPSNINSRHTILRTLEGIYRLLTALLPQVGQRLS